MRATDTTTFEKGTLATSLVVRIDEDADEETLHMAGWSSNEELGGGGFFKVTLLTTWGPPVYSLYSALFDPAPCAFDQNDSWRIRTGEVCWADGSVDQVQNLRFGWDGPDGFKFTVRFADQPGRPVGHTLLVLSRSEASTLGGALDEWMMGTWPLQEAGIRRATGFTHSADGSDLPDDDILRAMAALRGCSLVLPQPPDDALVIR
jgi:hypothetical protein